MKISDGYWLNRKGYSVNYANQAYEVSYDANSIYVLVTPSHIWNRGQTLGGPNFEMKFTSTMADVIRVSIVHYRGTVDCGPHFELHDEQGYTPIINDTEHYIEMITGKTSVKISKDNCRFSITATASTLQAAATEL